MKNFSKCKKLILIPIIIICLFICISVVGKFLSPLLIPYSVPDKITPLPADIDTSTDISTAKLRANLYNTATGYCEKEADDLRCRILNSKNTQDLYKISGTTYYVSSSQGDDNNDGLSPEKPLKSIFGIHKSYKAPGDAVLFKRGDTFRFGESLFTEDGLIYGAYGEGEKPKIYGSPENYAKSKKWEKHRKNIWKIPFSYPEASGVVINHGQIVGVKKPTAFTLFKNGDYYHDIHANYLYLYCDGGNPIEKYQDIEIMPSMTIIDGVDGNYNVTIDNLCLKYSAGFAIHVINALNFTVTNCEIGYVGGKWTSDHRVRYGNAIEFWSGAEDVKVDNNWVYQTYDSALTWQGKSGRKYINVSFSNNLLEYNNADIEFFETDGLLSNFVMKNNIMRFTSMGWGTRTYDGGIRGIEGCIRGVTGSHPRNKHVTVESAYFTDNIIDCPARQIINWSWEPEHSQVIHAKGTKLFIKDEYRTLNKCLQGLQTKKGESYYKRSASNLQELKQDFKTFEKDAEIYWGK